MKMVKTMKSAVMGLRNLKNRANEIENIYVKVLAKSGVLVLYVMMAGTLKVCGGVMKVDQAVTKAMNRHQEKYLIRKVWNSGVTTTVLSESDIPSDILAATLEEQIEKCDNQVVMTWTDDEDGSESVTVIVSDLDVPEDVLQREREGRPLVI